MFISGVEKIDYIDRSSGEVRRFYNLYSSSPIDDDCGVGDRVSVYSFDDKVLKISGISLDDLVDAYLNHSPIFCESSDVKGRKYIRQIVIVPVVK